MIEHISFEGTVFTVEQTIRYIIGSHAEKEVHIVWFGGEPLLGERIIDRISEGLMEAGVPYKSVMISNGSLITPEIIGKMTGLRHLYRIQITMDGNESDYITRKCYYKEDDQYHLVMRAIDRMSEKGIRVQVRCNVDLIREKCRSCPYLPDCTGFAGCPIHDSHCRELRELMAIDSLKRM